MSARSHVWVWVVETRRLWIDDGWFPTRHMAPTRSRALGEVEALRKQWDGWDAAPQYRVAKYVREAKT